MIYQSSIPPRFNRGFLEIDMKNAFLAILSLSAIFFIFVVIPPITLKEEQLVATDNTLSCVADDFSGVLNFLDRTAVFNGKKITVPQIAFSSTSYSVLGSNSENKWIEVDLSEQKLVAHEGDSIFIETPVSTGLPRTPTPTGEFRIWIKLRSARMQGGTGKYYYNLPNVPYVMYFSNSQVPGYRGYGLHGAYWHNDFGVRRSHGCVNLPIPVAEKLYYWVTPNIPEGKSMVKSSNENLGTRIIIHD